MSAGVLLVTVSGLVIAGGLVGLVTAARGMPLLPPRAPGARVRMPRLTPLRAAAFAAGVIVLLVTGWPVAAIATAGALVFVPQVLGGNKAAKTVIAKSEALAGWTRRLADLIGSGAVGSTREALRRSLRSAPDPIAAEVTRLVRRLGPQGVEPALRQFAREVGDPAAQKIAGVLILRERNGGPGLAEVLTALAADLDEKSRMVREVEAERAKPRANMRFVIIITATLMAGMMLFARTFLSTYSSVSGQLLLIGVAALFTGALRWMRRLSDPPANPSILVDPSVQVGAARTATRS